VVVHTGSRTLSMRWYPGEMGAARFAVQAAPVQSLLPIAKAAQARVAAESGTDPAVAGVAVEALAAARATLARGRNVSERAARTLITTGHLHSGAEWADEEEHPGEEHAAGGAGRWAEGTLPAEAWRTVYTGAHACATVAGLVANTVYRLRVVALNAAGDASVPSPEAQAVTLDNALVVPWTPGNAARQFVVEVPRAHTHAGPMLDLVVGDVCCWTEDVFVEGRGSVAPGAPAPPLKETTPDHAAAKFVCTRTLAATVLADNATRMGSGRTATTPPLTTTAATREVTVQVEWCTLGATDLPADHAWCVALRVPAGAIIKRPCPCPAPSATMDAASASGGEDAGAGAGLGACDVFRAPWEDEAGRWSVAEEVAASMAGWGPAR
jgi:hypothetical protein